MLRTSTDVSGAYDLVLLSVGVSPLSDKQKQEQSCTLMRSCMHPKHLRPCASHDTMTPGRAALDCAQMPASETTITAQICSLQHIQSSKYLRTATTGSLLAWYSAVYSS